MSDEEELHTPAEWQAMTGTIIYDADGWNWPGDERPWTDPISRSEWQRRSARSTVNEKREQNLAVLVDLIAKQLGRVPTEEEVVSFIKGSEEERLAIWNNSFGRV